MAAAGGLAPDWRFWDSLQEKVTKLLLRDAWADGATPQFRAEVFDSLLSPGYVLDPKNPPIVGVGLALEPNEKRPRLELLSTVSEENFTVDRFLKTGELSSVTWHVTRTGRIVASASVGTRPARRPAQGGDSIG